MPNTYTYVGSGGFRLGGGARVEYRRRGTGRRRFGYESVSGIETRRDGRGSVHIRRIIDRENDYYFESVVDCRTEEVLRHVQEPLSRHLGRGTEKRLKK